MEYVGDIKKSESVQRRWTRMIDGLQDMEYKDRLQNLGLFSIEGRLFRADLIKIWKIFNLQTDSSLPNIFTRRSTGVTRGHRFKLVVPVCRTDIKHRFFHVRRLITWNNLPGHIVESETLCSFKSQLDIHMRERFYHSSVV